MNIGQLIKEYRTNHEMSQQEFADRCGLSKPYISQIENNKNPKTGLPPAPSFETYIKLAKAMNMPIDVLFSLIDNVLPLDDGNVDFVVDTLIESKRNTAKAMDKTQETQQYYLDAETAKMAQELHDDPNLRAMFKAARFQIYFLH